MPGPGEVGPGIRTRNSDPDPTPESGLSSQNERLFAVSVGARFVVRWRCLRFTAQLVLGAHAGQQICDLRRRIDRNHTNAVVARIDVVNLACHAR